MTPLWLKIARQFIGLKETPGPANNAVIMGWARGLPAVIVGMVYSADSIPWCGLFVAHVIRAAGLMPPRIAVRANAWSNWGIPCDPCPGAVMVMKRPGGFHVFLYEGETPTHYFGTGGNQSDSVSQAWFPKSEVVACRWPDAAIPRGARVIYPSRGQVVGSMA